MSSIPSTASEIAAAVTAKRITARAVIDDYLSRIDARESEIHAFNLVMAQDARAQADAIDAAVAAANGEEINALMESLEALNLVRILCSHHGCKI